MSIENAYKRWHEVINSERIIGADEANHRYGQNTNASVRYIKGALLAKTQEEVRSIVRIANEEFVPLYPISAGHNWGYGTALPVSEDNIILDLSSMNAVIDCDKQLGVVTVEPGVTQQVLYDYLEENNLPFLVPLTGAGPKGSLVGNVLERGFGVTPFNDHFNAVTTITAVLADGTIYNSPLEEYGCPKIDQLYRYGIGPYLDGIFTQSNFGVVTKMTIALARKPEQTSVFFFSLNSHEELSEVVNRLPGLLSTLGSITCGLKFINKHQVEAVSEGSTKNKHSSLSFPEWTVTGGLFGDPKLIKAAKKIMRRELQYSVHTLFFINANFFQKYSHIFSYFPLPHSIKSSIQTLSLTIDLFLGKPSTAALPLAYLGSGTFPVKREEADPGKNGSGIIWFAPLLPMEGKIIAKYAIMVEETLKKYSLPPMVTFTSVNDRCFDAPLALVFNKNDQASTENAKKCYNELWNNSKLLGVMPYRLPIDEQYRVTESGTSFWDIAKKIKDALDPHGVIAPGRYSKK